MIMDVQFTTITHGIGFENLMKIEGATFTPSVSEEGILSWTNDHNLPNPAPVNIKGEQGERGLQGYSGVDGKDGNSLEVSVSKNDGGHTINIYTWSPDSDAPIHLDYFDVKNGEDGEDGFSPVIEVNYLPVTKATQIFITTADGRQTFLIPDGKAPVKGMDYWTDADKAEILAEVEEDWQLLCDTTTTEEIVNFAIDKDMNGNPFSCRKIYAQMILPTPLGKPLQPFFGNATQVWGGYPYIGLNVERDHCRFYDFSIELVKNHFAKFNVEQRDQEYFTGRNSGFGVLRTAGVNIAGLTKFFICNLYTENPFPVGTRILVWGCKA